MRSLSASPESRPISAFTLLEVMIALAIVLTIMVGTLEIVSHVEHLWKSEAMDSFAEAQDAFSIMTQNLAAATLESYQDFADSSGGFRTNLRRLLFPITWQDGLTWILFVALPPVPRDYFLRADARLRGAAFSLSCLRVTRKSRTPRA